MPVHRVAAPTLMCDLDEPEADQLGQRVRDRLPAYAETLEVIVGAGQLAVVGATVAHVLDLKTIKNLAGSEA